MQSIITPLALFDLENSMSYPNFPFDSDRSTFPKTQESYPYGTFNDNVINESQHSHLGWSNTTTPNSLETFLSSDGIFLQPSVTPPDGLHNTGNVEEYALWAWGSSPCSESPHVSPNGGYIASTSSSPAQSSVYSHEDAMPSPLQLNELSNAFDFDFSTPLTPDYLMPEYQSCSLPTSISRQTPPHRRNPHSPGPQRSREASPTNSETGPKRRFPCLILGCARRFTSQYTLKVHMEAHKPKPRVSFPCTLGCSERFSRQHDRLRHEVAKHGKVCEFLCSDCGRFFSTSKTLSNHKCPVAQCGTRWVDNAN